MTPNDKLLAFLVNLSEQIESVEIRNFDVSTTQEVGRQDVSPHTYHMDSPEWAAKGETVIELRFNWSRKK